MHAAVVRYDLHVNDSRSLKAKRAVVKPIVEGLRHRFSVSVAEVDHQDQWQRAAVGVAVVASSHAHLVDILESVDRFVWSHPEVDVLSAERSWVDGEG
jgi:uncharacterized protein YlxP (DUF503 family)